MSRSYWLPVFALVGLILAAQQCAKAQGEQSGTTQTQAGPRHQPKPTRSVAIQGGDQSVRAIVQSKSGEQKAQNTEEAPSDPQVRMADSAENMFYVGLAEMVITFAGVMLVLGTLIYTKRAVEAARDAIRNDRAWIISSGVRVIPTGTITVDDNSYENGLLVYIEWKNCGRTPSLRGEIYRDIAFREMEDSAPPAFTPHWSSTHRSSATIGPDMRCSSPPAFIVGKDYDEFLAGRCRAFVYAAIRYYDIYKPEEMRVSEACFDIISNGVEINRETGQRVPRHEIRSVGPQNTAT